MKACNPVFERGLGLAVFAPTLSWHHPVTAKDLLSDGDYRWLARNPNVTSDSIMLQGLAVHEKVKVHTLIDAPNLSSEQGLQAVAGYLTPIIGYDFERTVEQSEQ
jgi:hypothetical protein